MLETTIEKVDLVTAHMLHSCVKCLRGCAVCHSWPSQFAQFECNTRWCNVNVESCTPVLERHMVAARPSPSLW